MKRRILLTTAAILSVLVLASGAVANVLLSIPDDIEPPKYLTGGGPAIQEDGTPWAMHDGEWAFIPFYRTPDLPDDFDLLNDFDPNVFDKQLHITGWVEFTDDFLPFRSLVRGTGAVPVIFVKWSELQDAMDDGKLYIGELKAMESLRAGTASFYVEENHIYGVHPVSHLAVAARGKLTNGTSFDVRVVEVGLELKEVRIVFKD